MARATRRIPREIATRGFVADVLCLAFAGITAASIASPSFASRIGSGVACVLAVASLITRRTVYRPLSRAPGALALLFALWTFFSQAWSSIPDLSSRMGRDQIAMAFLFIAARVIIDTGRALLLVGAGYVVGCLVVLRTLLLENPSASLSFATSDTSRYTVEGINQNYVAYTLVSGLAVCLLLLSVARRVWPLWIAAAAALGAGVTLTGTRGALYTAIAVVVWRALVVYRLRRAALVGVIVAALGAAVVLCTSLADDRLREMFPYVAGRELGNLNSRLVVWPIARRMLYEHPVIGDGAGSVTLVSPHGIFAHNAALDVGSGLGLVGIGLFLGALWAALAVSTRPAPEPRRSVLVGTAVCAIALPLLSGYWLQAAPFWMLLALFSRIDVIGAPIRALQLGREVDTGVGVPGVDEQGAASGQAATGQREPQSARRGAG